MPILAGQFDYVGRIASKKFLHLPGQIGAEYLDIDLKITNRTQTIQISSTNCRPLAINCAGLRMQHSVTITKDMNASFKAFGKIAMRGPISNDMVGYQRHQDTYIDSTSGCSFQSVKQDVIRYKIG